MDLFFKHVPASGSIMNAMAIVAGSLAGLALHSRLPQRFVTITFQGPLLRTLFLGMFIAPKTQNSLVMAFSIVGGSLLGEYLD
ncbi:MAG: DUF554 domain-containing protein, partial [Synergistaceae bacterium]|nr:DUF554 domain-containing protein [Synergistaceae bacterium]